MFFASTVPPQINPFEFGEDAVNSGDLLMTTCFVTKGDLPIEISWTLNNKSINDIDGISVVSPNKRASQITIDSVEAHHRGEYKCIAKNKAGVSEFLSFLNVNGTFCTFVFHFLCFITWAFKLYLLFYLF